MHTCRTEGRIASTPTTLFVLPPPLPSCAPLSFFPVPCHPRELPYGRAAERRLSSHLDSQRRPFQEHKEQRPCCVPRSSLSPPPSAAGACSAPTRVPATSPTARHAAHPRCTQRCALAAQALCTNAAAPPPGSSATARRSPRVLCKPRLGWQAPDARVGGRRASGLASCCAPRRLSPSRCQPETPCHSSALWTASNADLCMSVRVRVFAVLQASWPRPRLCRSRASRRRR